MYRTPITCIWRILELKSENDLLDELEFSHKEQEPVNITESPGYSYSGMYALLA